MKIFTVLCASLCSASAFVIAGSRRGAGVTAAARAWGETATVSRTLGTRHMSMKTNIVDTIKSDIATNKVTIYSKSYCPYCTATKTTFANMGIKAKIFELDQMPNGGDIQASLLEMTGQRTVPNVFVNGEWVGGNDNTQAALKSGKLQKLLDKK